ncbi:class I SAM-dependent methyltransferase [Actinospica robiniae]|uniref:class I SAM-dependent methyltransferase n=1 Tax=Actinospica robiniae TaxID=304901 RepID=UPI0005542F75|nr:class I SAM-dependent methyltransferase [Actinospica robiniae]
MSEYEAGTDFDAEERRIWAGRAEAFQAGFAKLCAHTACALLDAAAVGPGVRLLDVGTGIGTVAAAACDRGAEVAAVDAEPGMVELARRNAPAADVREGVLPGLPFPAGSFDVVVANFVVNHVGRPAAAVAAMRAATRPGGRVAATIWCAPAGQGHELFDRAAEAAGAQPPASLPRIASEYDFPRTPEGFAGLFTAAGLADVSCETLSWDHLADPEEWWGGAAAGVGMISQKISRQDPDTIKRIKAAYDELTHEFVGPDGRLVLRYHALLAAGRVES